MKNHSIVLASGSGMRLGQSKVPKHLLQLDGVPLVVWTLNTILSSRLFDRIVVVTNHDNLSVTTSTITKYFPWEGERMSCILGAEERVQSFFNGYLELAKRVKLGDRDNIVLHDANRPFATVEQLVTLVDLIEARGCACLARPVVNGVASVAGENIVAVPAKDRFVEFVTPEGIQNRLLEKLAPFEGCRLPSLVDMALHLGVKPTFGGSSERNSKVTYPEDVSFLEGLQKKYQIERPVIWSNK